MDKLMRKFTLDFWAKGKHKITPEKFVEIEKCFLIDVRSREEFDSLSIKMKAYFNVECKNIPVDEVPDKINEIPQDIPIGVFCPGDIRSAIVYAYLLANGFSDVRIISGGYSALSDLIKPGKILKKIQNNCNNNL